MTSAGPDGDGRQKLEEECSQSGNDHRTYLIYHLDRVEHYPADQHRRIVISDSCLEIELGLLRELNNHVDQMASVCSPMVVPCDPGVPSEQAGETISENFHPGFKVTVVLSGGDEKKGIVRWKRDDSAGHDLQLL